MTTTAACHGRVSASTRQASPPATWTAARKAAVRRGLAECREVRDRVVPEHRAGGESHQHERVEEEHDGQDDGRDDELGDHRRAGALGDPGKR